MTLGEYLIRVRNERGYSQRELSGKCGISAAEICRIEAGNRQKPSPAVLKAIADALVIDYAYLLQLAGYIPENSQKQEKLAGTLTDPDGKLRDLYACADEMYRTDKEWLQTAYLISKELGEEDRVFVREIVEIMRERYGKKE